LTIEQDNNIILYTTHCPKCKVLQLKLEKLNLSFEICEDIETMETLGFKTSPMLSINNKIYNFQEAVKFLKGDS
jgi:glutaredoxin-related protein